MRLLHLAAASTLVSAACVSGTAPDGPARADDVIVPQPANTVESPAPVVAPPPDPSRLLRDPSASAGPAPGMFRVRFETTKGSFEVRCERAWAPHGVDRFHQLVKIGFFDDTAVFRVVSGFVAQFGIHGDPAVSRAWRDAEIPADEVKRSNTAGTLTFAMAGRPTSRTTQLFFNLVDNERLDSMGFAPVCEVVPPGLEVIGQLYSRYAEAASRQQGRIQDEGNAFLRAEFPDLDYVIEARIVPDGQNAIR